MDTGYYINATRSSPVTEDTSIPRAGPAVDERLRRRRALEWAERRQADGAAEPDSRRPQIDPGSSAPGEAATHSNAVSCPFHG